MARELVLVIAVKVMLMTAIIDDALRREAITRLLCHNYKTALALAAASAVF